MINALLITSTTIVLGPRIDAHETDPKSAQVRASNQHQNVK
jgi:hypothetical protein